MSEPQSNTTAGDLTPLFRVKLHARAEWDLLRDLESFVQFNRRGEYTKAIDLFDRVLGKHLESYPVVIEYMDLLFEQGDYKSLSNFSKDRISDESKTEFRLTGEEIQLLRVMEALANIFTKGALRSALVQAGRCRDFLRDQQEWRASGEFPSNVQIYAFEIYLRIVVFALQTSSWVTLGDIDPPWSETKLPAGTGVISWYMAMQKDGYLWEATRILRILLPILPMLPSDALDLLFSDEHRTWTAGERPEGTETTENDKWADLSMSLSKAHALLDTIVLDSRPPSNRQLLGFKPLYSLCKAYLDKAQCLGDIEGSYGATSHSQVSLERLDFAITGQILHSGPEFPGPQPPSTLPPSEVLSRKDYRMHVLHCVRGLLRDPNGISGSEKKLEILSECFRSQDQMGDLVGSIQTWELFSTLAENMKRPKSDKPVKSLLASERENAFLLLAGAREKPTTPVALQRLLMDRLEAIRFEDFRGKLSFENGFKHYEEHFDIPLYLWAYHRRKAPRTKESSQTKSHQDMRIAEEARNCLPSFMRDTGEQDDGEMSYGSVVVQSDSLSFGPKTYVHGNVFACSENVYINGETSIGGDFQVSGSIYINGKVSINGQSIHVGKRYE